MTTAATTSTLDALLHAFWLRPETALWRELDIRAMATFHVRSPSLDLGCGDGTFSFIRAGGVLSDRFDAMATVRGLDEFFAKADVFDAFDPSVPATVVREPAYRIDVGLDQKPNLLNKARQLRFYEQLKASDASARLPFADATFNSVFSNIVYWLARPEQAFIEIARVLRDGGQACVMLPNRTLPEFSFYNALCVAARDDRWAFLEKLDRGRFADNIRHARAAVEWERMFHAAGLRIVHHGRHLSRPVIQMWDVGLRPLFPALRKMADAVPPDRLPAIKHEWVGILRRFLEPIADLDRDLAPGVEPGFHCYILEK